MFVVTLFALVWKCALIYSTSSIFSACPNKVILFRCCWLEHIWLFLNETFQFVDINLLYFLRHLQLKKTSCYFEPVKSKHQLLTMTFYCILSFTSDLISNSHPLRKRSSVVFILMAKVPLKLREPLLPRPSRKIQIVASSEPCHSSDHGYAPEWLQCRSLYSLWPCGSTPCQWGRRFPSDPLRHCNGCRWDRTFHGKTCWLFFGTLEELLLMQVRTVLATIGSEIEWLFSSLLFWCSSDKQISRDSHRTKHAHWQDGPQICDTVLTLPQANTYDIAGSHCPEASWALQ